MDQKSIDEIRRLDKLISKCEKTIKKAREKSKAIWENCDHKYPNGKSAIAKNTCFDYCKICETEIY